MAIDDLPGPVVTFLNVLGIPWPYIDEDAIYEFSSLVRRFGQAVETTHQEGSRHVAGFAEAYKSASTQKMADGWQKMTDAHVNDILEGCTVLADALEVAAGYVVAQKGAALAELVGMAVSFLAAQAAAPETLGLSEGAVPLIIKGAEKLMDSLIQDLEQFLISKVVEAGAKPLMAKVEKALSGLDWSQSGAVSSGQGTGFELDEAPARAHAEAMGQYAADMRSHAQVFASGIRGLNF